jgi:hypothetical protein
MYEEKIPQCDYREKKQECDGIKQHGSYFSQGRAQAILRNHQAANRAARIRSAIFPAIRILELPLGGGLCSGFPAGCGAAARTAATTAAAISALWEMLRA